MVEMLKALRFLTILPLPLRDTEGPIHPATMPWVGLILGSLLVLVDQLFFRFPEMLRGGMLVFTWVLLTGGLHLDGLADTVDGVFSRKPAPEALAIMSQGTIGALGATALILVLMLKAFSLATLPVPIANSGLLLSPALSRWGVALAAARFPTAKTEGLAVELKQRSGRFPVLTNLPFVAVLSFLLLGWEGLVIVGGVWLLTEVSGRYLVRTLGGLTGDTHGALNEALEAGTLVFMAGYQAFL